jgi:hypothetical protein
LFYRQGLTINRDVFSLKLLTDSCASHDYSYLNEQEKYKTHPTLFIYSIIGPHMISDF